MRNESKILMTKSLWRKEILIQGNKKVTFPSIHEYE